MWLGTLRIIVSAILLPGQVMGITSNTQRSVGLGRPYLAKHLRTARWSTLLHAVILTLSRHDAVTLLLYPARSSVRPFSHAASIFEEK